MSDLFASPEAARSGASAACRPAAAGKPGGCRRPGASDRPGRRADPDDCLGQPRQHHLLGAAGHRQDDDRPAAGRRDRTAFRADLGDLQRCRRSEEGVRSRTDALQNGKQTLLFVDEIHRFNRAQQDSFLPVVEDGTILLVGATTENPSFELNAALLSRARVLTLKRLEPRAIWKACLQRAESRNGKTACRWKTRRGSLLAVMADGDGRAVLTLAEEVFRSPSPA
jgi:hypothetical protein